MKKIGITCAIMPPDAKRTTFAKKQLFYAESDFMHYFSSESIMPILIPKFDTREQLNNFLANLDAIVLQGGDDICPEFYQTPYLNKEKWPGNKLRDKYELAVMDYAFLHKLPVLGICRGLQIINVYFGGTLYQDIKTEGASELTHRDAARYDGISHAIAFEKDSHLAKQIYPAVNQPSVNSVHHQAIKQLANNLIVEARCPDDKLIEAVRYNSTAQFIYAVQWHPEFSHTLGNKVLDPQPLLDYFIQQIHR